MPEVLEGACLPRSSRAVILARMVRGLTAEGWAAASENGQLSQWQALPLPDEEENDAELENVREIAAQGLPVTPFREVAGALYRSTFVNLLQRELLRLSRNGGSLSLISASLADRRAVAEREGEAAACRLEALLGRTLLSRMDSCDALGLTRRGVFICSLPGLGQLAARRFAETARDAFNDAADPAGAGVSCAMGIVNVLQGEACAPSDLLRRARATLDVALRKQEGYIHQEAAMAPFEGTTLVHSSEKRFLFFGGDPK